MPVKRKPGRPRKTPIPPVPPETVGSSPAAAMNEALAQEAGTDLKAIAKELGFREELVEAIDMDDLARRVAKILEFESAEVEKVTVRQRPVRHIRRDFCDLKDPSRHMKLVRDTEKRVQYHKRLGYEPVKPEDVADHDGWLGADGIIHHGDRIAMSCPNEMFEERKRDLEAENAEQASVVEDANEQAAKEDGRPGGGLHKYPEHAHQQGRRVFPMS